MPSLEEVVVHLKATDDMSGKVRGARQEVERLGRTTDQTDVSTRRASSSAGDLTSALGGLHGGLTRASGALGDFAGQQLRRATLGLVGMTAAAVGFGIKSGAQFESSRISFGTLLEDVEAGNRLFADLQAFNLKTPFELGDLTNSTQQLLAYGFAGQEAFGITKSITDVAAAAGPRAGEALNRIAFALGQVRSKGIQMEEVRQLQEAYFPALAILTEVTGKTGAELQDAMRKGLDPEVTTRFLQVVESGQAKSLQKFKGGAEAQAKTLLGVWSNFRDNLNVALADETSPLAKRLSAGLPELQTSLNGLITTVLPPLIDLLGDAVDAAPGLVTELGPFMRDAIEFGREFVPVLGDLADIGREVLPVLSGIAGFVGDMFDTFPLADEAAAGLLTTLLAYRALSAVTSTVAGLATAFQGLAGAQAAAAATSGTGAAGGAAAAARAARVARLGAAGAGLGLTAYSASQEQSLLGDAGTVGGAALTGAMVGSIIPGLGTAIGGGVGAAIGGGIVLGRRWSAADSPSVPAAAARGASQVSTSMTVAPGAITVDARGQQPAQTSDAILEALQRWREDEERRTGQKVGS